jgi:anthranilate synthase component 2
MIKVLLLDNHDSFTYNLAELLRRNDKINFQIDTAETFNLNQADDFDKIIFSPGPGVPREHSVIFDILAAFGQKKSIFGVCLGMQAMALHFGGALYNLEKVVHGQVKTIEVISGEEKIFAGIPRHFEAGLYHSWAVNRKTLPEDLIVTSLSEDGIIMGLSHRKLDISGVQFHPESIMTPLGQRMIDNWIGH